MDRKRVKTVCPAFKGFLIHAHEGMDYVDADDGRYYVLHLRTRAFASDADDAVGGLPRHAHTGVHAPLEPGSAALRVAKRITGAILGQPKSLHCSVSFMSMKCLPNKQT